MKNIKPYRLIVSIPVEIDLNELLAGYKLNTTIAEIKKNIGKYIRDEMKSYSGVPGEEIPIPAGEAIIGNLQEWDLTSYDD
jgi:hypothetical protein